MTRVAQSLFTLIFTLFAFQIPTAQSQEIGGIAAIVNDEVISIYDVNQRTSLFLVTSGIEQTPQIIERLRGQVLRSLIDEMMQLQAARDAEIKIQQEEIDASIKRIARDFGGDMSAITDFLDENKISIRALETQIAAELAWSYFVQRKFSGRVSISQIEIDEAYNRALESLNQSRYNVSEILLLVDNPAEEEQARNLANEIVSQLRGGVDFAAYARQFSNASSSAQGGQIGWSTLDDINAELRPALQNIRSGEISDPIRTNSGFHILKLNAFQQSGGIDSNRHIFDLLLISFKQDDPNLADHLKQTRDSFKTCKQAEQEASQYGAVNTQRTGERQLGTFMGALKSILIDLEAGEISPSVRTKESVDLIVVCDRKDDQGASVSREEVEDNIYQQRMSMMSRRHMRELRRDAVIEYR